MLFFPTLAECRGEFPATSNPGTLQVVQAALQEQLEEGFPVEVGGEQPDELEVAALLDHEGLSAAPARGKELLRRRSVVVQDPLQVLQQCSPVRSLQIVQNY